MPPPMQSSKEIPMVMVRTSRFSSSIMVIVSKISRVFIITVSRSFPVLDSVHRVENILVHDMDF